MRKKNFKMGEGKYYFNVRNGQQNITIMRDTKKQASNAFLNYKQIGKDCEWLGCWNGKDFSETKAPVSNAA